MSFRLVTNSMTLNDLERRNGHFLRNFTEFGNDPYFALFHRIRVRCRRKTIVRFPRFQNRRYPPHLALSDEQCTLLKFSFS